MSKATICLWFDSEAEQAARFYARHLPQSAVGAVHRAPADNPSGKAGAVLMVKFTLCGLPCLGRNGGPAFPQTEAFSFQIANEDQAETDRLWAALTAEGGRESQCGWCKDRWGVNWQITPRPLIEALARGGAPAKRVFEAIMPMKKIDLVAVEAALRG